MHHPTAVSALPAFSYADFRVVAKIDFITIDAHALIPVLRSMGDDRIKFVGRIELPKRTDAVWMTIHDPSRADLQFLVETVPESEILGLEVTLDFLLTDGTSRGARLCELHRHLTVNLYPNRHQRFNKATRKLYVGDDRKIRLDKMKTGNGHTTRYWREPRGFEAIRLYIKTHDNKQPVLQQSVRLELTMTRGGCQMANTHRMCLLPNYLHNIRRNTSKAFQIAAGIKPNIKRTRATKAARLAKAEKEAAKERRKVERAYAKYGACWVGEHGYRVVPDTTASAMIGNALKQLREQFLALKLPEESAELPAKWDYNSDMYQGVADRSADTL